MTERNLTGKNIAIPWKREVSIMLPSPELENCIAIRRLDVERIKKELTHAKKKKPRLDLVYPFLFGITVTSGVSIATFYAGPQSGLPNWVYPLFLLMFVFSLATGFIFAYLDENLKKEEKTEIDNIIEDLKSIEDTFQYRQISNDVET